VIGDITTRTAARPPRRDEIVLEEPVANQPLSQDAQVFACCCPIGTVGVMGDARSYDSVIAIRAVEARTFMTADWARIPFTCCRR
jgi:GMP synthase (glutamine-hydrolysing)